MNAPSTPQQVTLAQLSQAQQKPQNAVVTAGFFNSEGFELMQRVAKAFASSTLVPQTYQGNVPNCMIALNLAQRLKADELMVMQNLYIVHGNPGWSSKFLIACVNTCGRYSAMRYEWRGDAGADDFGCRAWALEKDTGERLNGVWVDWKMVKAEGWNAKNGSKWKTMPEQMFVYRAAAFWQRAYAPEISMGLSSAEELNDTYEAQSVAPGVYAVDTESLRQTDQGVQDAAIVGEPPSEPPAEPKQPTRRAKAEPASAPTAQTGLTFAYVAEQITKAKGNADALDAAADLISKVENEEHRAELSDMYNGLRYE